MTKSVQFLSTPSLALGLAHCGALCCWFQHPAGFFGIRCISPEEHPVQHQCCVVPSNPMLLQGEDCTANWAEEKPWIFFLILVGGETLIWLLAWRWVEQRGLLPHTAPKALLSGVSCGLGACWRSALAL